MPGTPSGQEGTSVHGLTVVTNRQRALNDLSLDDKKSGTTCGRWLIAAPDSGRTAQA